MPGTVTVVTTKEVGSPRGHEGGWTHRHGQLCPVQPGPARPAHRPAPAQLVLRSVLCFGQNMPLSSGRPASLRLLVPHSPALLRESLCV